MLSQWLLSKRQWLAVMLILCGCIAGHASEADGYNSKPAPKKIFSEGKHYTVLAEPIAGEVAPVLEFFYFGCRTCYQLVPAIANWSHKTGIAVSLVPVHSQTAMTDAARLYHTFAEMGVLAQMYELGYVIFQTEASELQGKARIDDFLLRHKVDQQRFWELWSSDAVNRRLAASLALTQQAQIYKTPAFVVQGRYLVDIDAITEVEQLFQLLDYLNKIPVSKT